MWVYSGDFFVGLFLSRELTRRSIFLSSYRFRRSALALIELPELKEAINLSWREHTGQMIDIVELFTILLL